MSAQVRLGNVVATPAALDTVPTEEVAKALARHASGDWGEVDEHDWTMNDMAFANGDRLLSVYTAGDVKFWIITEADRSATTILLPSDY